MGLEIEYRYLLDIAPAVEGLTPERIRQGYLSVDPGRTVRVRIKAGRGFLTIKGPRRKAVAAEFEYEIPPDDAQALLALCGEHVLDKDRYSIAGPDGFAWDVDIFTGRHGGLMIAEIELPAEDTAFIVPGWLHGADITGRAEFSNAALAQMPQAALDTLLQKGV